VQKLLDEGKAVSRSKARRLATLAEDKMHKITQMTESETQEEIAKVTEYVFKSSCENTGAAILPEGPIIRTEIKGAKAGVPMDIYVTKSGRVYKSKPGRRLKGSRNKPKEAI
jgi:hypothetical protein